MTFLIAEKKKRYFNKTSFEQDFVVADAKFVQQEYHLKVLWNLDRTTEARLYTTVFAYMYVIYSK